MGGGGSPCPEGGGRSVPQETDSALQGGSVIRHCQQVCATCTCSHALKQLCYEKFQTNTEVESTEQ